MQTADAVVVGGGFAGAATAYHLTRRGLANVVILEQEDLPGRHASGRNAGVARRLVATPAHLPLALEGVRFMENPPDDFPPGRYFERTGSVLVGGPEMETRLRASVAAGRSTGVAGEWLSAAEVERLVPVTAGGAFVGGAYSRDDGVADIAALLDAFLRAARAAGARVMNNARLHAVETDASGVAAIATDRETIATRVLVNAAGAWSSEVARLAGAAPLPLRSLKRHIMVTAPLPWADKSWPAVWDLSHEVYFRPEPPGLLLSPCDAVESAPEAGATNDRGALELLASKLLAWLPALADVAVATMFAGLRTFAPDGNMVLGPDPRLPGFYWCSGLGGNGMTLSPALGRIVADAVLGHAPPAEHAAARFAA